MKILIENVPPGVATEDIQSLLAPFSPDPGTLSIDLLNNGNADSTTAVVHFSGNLAEAKMIADKLDQRYWKERHIHTYVPLFMRQ